MDMREEQLLTVERHTAVRFVYRAKFNSRTAQSWPHVARSHADACAICCMKPAESVFVLRRFSCHPIGIVRLRSPECFNSLMADAYAASTTAARMRFLWSKWRGSLSDEMTFMAEPTKEELLARIADL